MTRTFDEDEFYKICDRLFEIDSDLHSIYLKYGYPPFWSRKPNFETLIHIVLEQQVSLASAKAALDKLKKKIGIVTAKKIVLLSDLELRECYFSRQKTVYAKELAKAVLEKQIVISQLKDLPEETIRTRLTAIKGIGNWTVDIYLLMALHRTDIFPIGDLALLQSLKKVKRLPPQTSQERIRKLSEKWEPYRSIATMLFWHSYLEERKRRSKEKTS
ncbi:DNA-3-methyladenine glycosylase family protein [Leptospira stimsonii]|uniref:DNA-3-methyladenine glycosylase II n=1 Tax=Leptospira stimsonii TaxID=2202203 RepID=A0A4R9L9Q8_9LEPT|nr:DNA-3-methyladenine glycosylase [Leptospira stimsonii]RHX83706.1 DNA-3-methyladenine glycosylase 2 family protein [Leptospira stimsonii]TGK18537.1 DNA-3-methyladenine glycosylase 2 family protein [Leptospira stimsonii]TGM21823.1 DNA-3-methyladenine glycosylase 2 family protein [Leptospira stimsonii]